MILKALYSYACAAVGFGVVAATLGGCFSERVAGPAAPSASELCAGTQTGVVRIRNFAFGPAELRVKAGTRVAFANCDAVQHSSTSDTDVWDSGLISPNTVYERTFTQPGRYPFHCEPHPSMTGVIVVE